MNRRWTLAEAQVVADQLNGLVVEANCHIGMAGGVLLSGSSDNDLDLVLLPLNPPFGPPDYDLARAKILGYMKDTGTQVVGLTQGFWMHQVAVKDGASVAEEVENRTTDFYRYYYQGDMPIDVIIVRTNICH